MENFTTFIRYAEILLETVCEIEAGQVENFVTEKDKNDGYDIAAKRFANLLYVFGSDIPMLEDVRQYIEQSAADGRYDVKRLKDFLSEFITLLGLQY